MDQPVIIIGAGLCGLALAHSLQARGVDWLLLDARHRLGGRVHTVEADNGAALDLGPTWYWPDTQPSIARLVADLALPHWAQPDDGRVLLLDDAGRPPRPLAWDAAAQRLAADEAEPATPGAVHGGARRLQGGMRALVDALAAALPPERIRLGCAVHRLERLRDGGLDAVRISGQRRPPDAAAARAAGTPGGLAGVPAAGTPGGLAGVPAAGEPFELLASRVVLALPPRVAAEAIACEPPLPEAVQAAQRATPTWMAAAAKAAVACGWPAWRDAGLAGNAWVTHAQAVLAEVFDAGGAPDDPAAPAALAGFCAMGAGQRQPFVKAMPMLVTSQVTMLFGPELEPAEVYWQDWATEGETCTAADLAEDAGAQGHPAYGHPALTEPLWDGRLLLGGSETASRGGGYLEGALNAAARLRRQLAEALTAESALSGFAQWVRQQREGALQRYRSRLNQALAQQQADQLTQRAILDSLQSLYQDALDILARLAPDGSRLPLQQGRHPYTPQVLAPFEGLADELLAEAMRYNATSCALSNFPDEHRLSGEYVRTIRRDLAAAWAGFALDANALLAQPRGATGLAGAAVGQGAAR